MNGVACPQVIFMCAEKRLAWSNYKYYLIPFRPFQGQTWYALSLSGRDILPKKGQKKATARIKTIVNTRPPMYLRKLTKWHHTWTSFLLPSPPPSPAIPATRQVAPANQLVVYQQSSFVAPPPAVSHACTFTQAPQTFTIMVRNLNPIVGMYFSGKVEQENCSIKDVLPVFGAPKTPTVRVGVSLSNTLNLLKFFTENGASLWYN